MSYTEKLFGLEGSTAAITGGGGAIAGALAEAYLKAGARVSLWGHRMESIREARDLLAEKTGLADRIHVMQCDAFSEKDVEKALRSCESEMGPVDILVNAAGGNRSKGSFKDLDVKVFQEVVNLNLVAGLIVPTKVVTRYWEEKNIEGSIINLASMSSYIPLSGVWGYNASKSAVLNLTMACAKEFAPLKIRVNAVAPGFFIGKQNRDLLIDKQTGDLTQRGKDVIDHTPFGRFGDVAELAGTVLFLSSRKASGFVTGVSIPVDGGYLINNI